MKYSILVPAYKSKFFRECIDSILGQTYTDFELIILNDCSPEPIKDIVYEYNDKRIRYFENEKNVGAVDVVNNWNKLLNLAQGDYVLCMGDDDKLAPDFLEEYNQLIIKYPNLDVYHARALMIDEKSVPCDIQQDRPDWESVFAVMWECNFCTRVQFVGDFLYRKETLKKVGGYYFEPLAWGSDYITPEIVAVDKGIANSHKPTFYYRQNSLSITSSKNVRYKMEAIQQSLEWTDKFISETPAEGLDVFYKSLLLKGTPRLHKSKLFMMAEDLSVHPFSSLSYWLSVCHKYELSHRDVFLSCAIALGLKIRGLFHG